MTPKFALPHFGPFALKIDVGPRFDSHDEDHPSLREQAEQSHVRKAPIGGDHDTAFADSLDDSAHGPTHHRQFLAFHASFADTSIIGAPIHRYGSTAHDERDDKHMLFVFNGPINGQAHFAMLGQLMDRLQQHGIRSQPGIESLIMEQPGYPFDSSFLLAKITCSLGLTGRLWLDDRRNIVTNGFALMAMCPGQHKRDIIV